MRCRDRRFSDLQSGMALGSRAFLDPRAVTIDVMGTLARAIRSLFRMLFSEQGYYERLETCERARSPGRLRWFG
jgi:hypothetical protein